MGLFKYFKERRLKAKEKQIKTEYSRNKLKDIEIIKQGVYYAIIRTDKNNKKYLLGKFHTLLEAMDYYNKIARKRSENDS